ncbi:hypothetical protein EYF80_042720 [Liparis tanakae]|uniref:Uncharacterized protein n=1 Tax=Liparis tanakae TaxID=230148 RepID=A0A4Z2G0F9_9TELE|nr:hypothetical protein EYF80_042720 [Liparis tanakae]
MAKATVTQGAPESTQAGRLTSSWSSWCLVFLAGNGAALRTGAGLPAADRLGTRREEEEVSGGWSCTLRSDWLSGEAGSVTEVVDEHAAHHGAAAAAQAQVEALQDALRRRPEGRGHRRAQEGDAGGPNRGVGHTWGTHRDGHGSCVEVKSEEGSPGMEVVSEEGSPGVEVVSEEGSPGVEVAALQAPGKRPVGPAAASCRIPRVLAPAPYGWRRTEPASAVLPDVSDQLDELVAGEVGGELGHVADHGADPEQRGGPLQVLQVPVQEGEDEAVAEAHEPGHEEHGAVAHAAQDPQQVAVVELRRRLGGTQALGLERRPRGPRVLHHALRELLLGLHAVAKVKLGGHDERHGHQHPEGDEGDLVVVQAEAGAAGAHQLHREMPTSSMARPQPREPHMRCRP